MVVLLVLLIVQPQFGRDASGNLTGPIYFSVKGPGSQRALLIISLAAGLIIGFLAQRSRFCTVGAIRDAVIMRDNHLLYGNPVIHRRSFYYEPDTGQFNPGFIGQPAAHTDQWWNFAVWYWQDWLLRWQAAVRKATFSCR